MNFSSLQQQKNMDWVCCKVKNSKNMRVIFCKLKKSSKKNLARLKELKIHTFNSLQVRKISKSMHWIFYNVKKLKKLECIFFSSYKKLRKHSFIILASLKKLKNMDWMFWKLKKLRNMNVFFSILKNSLNTITLFLKAWKVNLFFFGISKNLKNH